MDYSEEIQEELSRHTSNIDPMTVEIVRLAERVKIFNRLRELIHQKQSEGDVHAENILGWAYEQMSR